MTEPDQAVGQVADVRLHAPGDVPGVGADDADPHAAPAGSRRGRGRRATAAAACASRPGAAAMPVREAVGHRLGHGRDVAGRDLVVEGDLPAVRGERQVHGDQRGAGLAAPATPVRPASAPSRRRSRRRSRAESGRGRPAGRPSRPPRAARPARRTAAGRRRSAAAPPCRATRGRPRSGRRATRASSRSATVVNGTPVAANQAPAASQLPLCGSAKTTPRPRGEQRAHGVLPDRAGPVDDALRSAVTGSRNTSRQ